jgi:hypothetical protein
MPFDPTAYGPEVATILAIDDHGQRLMPLVAGVCSSPEAASILKKQSAAALFPSAAHPRGALAGLWLYFSAFDEAHSIAQDDPSSEGSLWHAILHRQEPDEGNAGYWFRRAGAHPIYPILAGQAAGIAARYPAAGFQPSNPWDPYQFVNLCNRAIEEPGSAAEDAAREIQRAEWQILFDYCARPKV